MNDESGFFKPADTHLHSTDSYTDFREIYVSATGFARLLTAKRAGRIFVFKCLRPEYRHSPTALATLRKEYDCGWAIDSPHVVHTLDFTDIDPYGPAIRLEYCPGDTLATLIERGTLLAAADIDKIVTGVVTGTSHIHAAGIVHRDIKPSNIIYCASTGKVSIIDMGCADSDAFTILHAAAGTPDFTPGDVANETRKPDCASDFYAVGVTLSRLAVIAPAARRKRLLRLASEMIGGKISNSGEALRCYGSVPQSKAGLIVSAAIAGGIALALMLALTGKTVQPVPPASAEAPQAMPDSSDRAAVPVPAPEAPPAAVIEQPKASAVVAGPEQQPWPDFVPENERVKNANGVALAEAKYLAIFKTNEVDNYIVERTDTELQLCIIDYTNSDLPDAERIAARERYYSPEAILAKVMPQVLKRFPEADRRRIRGMVEQRIAVWQHGYAPLPTLVTPP